jgi:hypothetical protein
VKTGDTRSARDKSQVSSVRGRNPGPIMSRPTLTIRLTGSIMTTIGCRFLVSPAGPASISTATLSPL